MSFAAGLTKITKKKKTEQSERIGVAKIWTDYEARLLDQAVELFKQRCVREAEQQRCEATVSFEVLSREIEDFPKRVLTDSTYFVASWGEGVTAESWFYAVRGATATFSAGAPILLAEVLQGMLPKFVERVKARGPWSAATESPRAAGGAGGPAEQP
ncbi:unnamed protein product, partial [Prorocentrum cordatum]